MRCNICDRGLSNDEIKYEPEYGRGNFSPCNHCLEIIGEVFEPQDEEEIERQLSMEELWSEENSESYQAIDDNDEIYA